MRKWKLYIKKGLYYKSEIIFTQTENACFKHSTSNLRISSIESCMPNVVVLSSNELVSDIIQRA